MMQPAQRNLAVLVEDTLISLQDSLVLGSQSTAMLGRQGKPYIHDQLLRLGALGFSHVIIVLQQLDPFVEAHLAMLSALQPDCAYEWLLLPPELAQAKAGKLDRLLRDIASWLVMSGRVTPLQTMWLQPLRYQVGNSMPWLQEMAARIEVHGEHEPLLGCLLNPAPAYQGTMSITVPDWLDVIRLPPTGHTDAVAARCFNQLVIEPQAGYVRKSSFKTAKMNQEISFYQQIPSSLCLYFPRLLAVSQTGETASYQIEYFPFRSLSQYFVFYPLPLSRWQQVFEQLLDIHARFCAQSGPAPDSARLFAFYWNKTQERLAEARLQPGLQALIEAPVLQINGRNMAGISKLQPIMQAHLQRLCKTATSGFLHGDLCFSNILYDPNSSMLRLIDPRGDFMGSVNQGDPRYDLAKLLHSIHGRYDFILNDLFEISVTMPTDTVPAGAAPAGTAPAAHPPVVELQIGSRPETAAIEQAFMSALQQYGQFALKDLILLEALLFLSMLPLHQDKPLRQKAFLMTGIRLLNDLYTDQQGELNAPVY